MLKYYSFQVIIYKPKFCQYTLFRFWIFCRILCERFMNLRVMKFICVKGIFFFVSQYTIFQTCANITSFVRVRHVYSQDIWKIIPWVMKNPKTKYISLYFTCIIHLRNPWSDLFSFNFFSSLFRHICLNVFFVCL